MDHEYAAPPSDPSPGVAPYLLDHTFAKPPAESPMYDKNDNCSQKFPVVAVSVKRADAGVGNASASCDSSLPSESESVDVDRSPRKTREKKEPVKSPGRVVVEGEILMKTRSLFPRTLFNMESSESPEPAPGVAEAERNAHRQVHTLSQRRVIIQKSSPLE
ncbi:hypothetical protein BaRGS_00016416 [Batillaria attramentaria]|uniref:Uncharacterized protein n=1 Tax=Batillaria attramentaria TaxID=370345 RepID=A0ABD0KYQ4_9CAEN